MRPDPESEPRPLRRWNPAIQYALLAGVLILGGVLRFHDLSTRGLIYWDEAKFALEGLRVHTALGSLLGSHGDRTLGKAIGSAKPTHALFIAIGYALFGVNAGAAFAFDALAGTADLLLTYLIARRLFCPWVSVIAALFLAVNEYDVLYARSALSESDTTLFLLVGFYLSVREWTAPAGGRRGWTSRLRVLPAAIVLGIGFTTNYRLIVYIGTLVVVDLVWSFVRRSRSYTATRLLCWIAGLLVAPLLWQLADLAARGHGITLFAGDLTGQQAYLRQVWYQLHQGKQAIYHFAPWLYLQWYVVRSGWPLSLLVSGGLVLALYRRERGPLSVAVMVLVPYGLYSLAPFVVPRNMVEALPFTAILGAWAAWELGQKLFRSDTLQIGLAALLSLFVILTSLPASWQVTQIRSGFAEAAAYLSRHGGRALTTSEDMVFYLRGNGARCLSPALPVSVPRLADYIHAGYRYAVLDPHHTSDVSHYIRAYAVRVLHRRTLGEVSLPDNPINSENTNPPPGDTTKEYIDVYRLDNLHLKGTGEPIQPCSRDAVT